jgi:hypothetical protein
MKRDTGYIIYIFFAILLAFYIEAISQAKFGLLEPSVLSNNIGQK